MIKITVSDTINRPVDEVFAHWADGRRYNQWDPSALKKDVRLLTPEPIGVGSRFRGTFKGMGEIEYEILEYEQPRHLAMVTANKMGTFYHTIDTEPIDSGTRVTQHGRGELKGVFKLLSPVLNGIFRKSFVANGVALKSYLERRPLAVA